jgi:tetratricopeptide (TPR) repeat protein
MSAQDPAGGTDLGAEDFTNLLGLALSVSGYEDAAQRKKVQKAFMLRLDAIEKTLPPDASISTLGRTLLTRLHQPNGVLRKYNARATTLRELIEKGEFNCLSASVLFALIAKRHGLDVVGELLPSHARILIKGPKRLYRVETTSPEGFDPSPQVLRRILAQSIGAEPLHRRSLVDTQGAQTTIRLLIALIYVNRASIAQEQGELRRAENLFRRGEDLARNSPMRKILREQRAALLSQLGANDMMSKMPSRQLRAFKTMLRSSRLDPEERMIRDAVHQNLRAAAERVIANWALSKRSDADILALASEALDAGLSKSDGAALRAFALSEIARKRARASDYDGALSAMDEAMYQSLAPRDAKLKTSLHENHVAALRLAAMTSAKLGAYAKSMQIIERLLSLQGISASQRREYESDRKRAMLLSGGKAMEDSRFLEAAVIYRAGRRLYPHEQTFKHNLIAALERQSLIIVNEGRCEQVSALLREIHALDPAENFTRPAQIRCLLIHSNRRIQDNDYPEAIAWLKSARAKFPADEIITENLVLAYMKWLQYEVGRGACRNARQLALQIGQIAGSRLSQIQEIAATCMAR